MAAVNFPNNPSVNDTHTSSGSTWKWDGTVWQRVGVAGPQGAQGVQGAAGAAGAAGAQGAQGRQGAAGSAGAQGAAGAQGHQGVQGAAGSATINNNADNRIITGSNTTGELNAESNITCDGTRLMFDDRKILLGEHAGYSNPSDDTFCVGYVSGYSNPGNHSINIGYASGYSNAGDNSINLGKSSAYGNSGDNSINIGDTAGYSNAGEHCINIGKNAGYQSGGKYGVNIGYNAGNLHSVNSSHNVAIGYEALKHEGSNKYCIGIGASCYLPIKGESTGASDNQLVIGVGHTAWIVGTKNYNVGLGITNPNSTLHVATSSSPAQGSDYAALSLGSPAQPLRKVEIGARRSTRGGDWDHVGIGFKVHESTNHLVAPVTKMVLDYDGNLGIGTVNPSNQLHIADYSADVDVTIQATASGKDARLNLYAHNTGVSQIRLGDDTDTDIGRITYYHSASGTAEANSLEFITGDSARVRVASSGLVLPQTSNEIRTDSSDGSDTKRIIIAAGGDNSQSRGAQIALYGNEYSSHQGRLQLLAGNSGNTNGVVEFYTGGSERLHLEADGDLRIGKDDSNYGWIRGFNGNTGDMIFDADKSTTGNGGSNLIFRTRSGERVRITHAGKLGIGNDSPSSFLHVRGSGYETLKLENNDNGADGPYIELYNNSSSPADNDYIGIINFKGRNDNNEEINFAGIRGRAPDVSDGTEDGTLSFHTRLNGSYTQQILLRQDGDVVLGGSLVNKDVDTSSWVLAGGNNSNVGGNITLYGSSHSGSQSVIRFRNSASEAMRVCGDGDVAINRADNTSNSSLLHLSSHDVTTKYNNDNATTSTFLIDTHHTGSQALTANRSKIGIRMDMEYSGTGTKSNTSGNRCQLYGVYSSVDATKDVYTSYGGYFYSNMTADDQANGTTSYGVYGYGRNYSAGGSNRSSTIAGGYFLGYRGGDINGGHCYGVYARAHNINNTGDNTGDMTGVYAEAENDKDVTVTNAYAFRGYLDRDAGTVTNSYILYGSHGGDAHFTNRWGIHISDCAKSYLGGNLTITGALSKGSGSFRIPHPLVGLSTTKDLVHSFIEGPQCDLIYRGKVDLVGGTATINIDTKAGMTEGTFVTLCRDIQCFTSNETGWTAVKGSVTGNKITIIAQDNSCTDTISWMVVGERQDDNIKESELTDADGNLIVEPDKRTDIVDKYQAENEKNEYNEDPNSDPGSE